MKYLPTKIRDTKTNKNIFEFTLVYSQYMVYIYNLDINIQYIQEFILSDYTVNIYTVILSIH